LSRDAPIRKREERGLVQYTARTCHKRSVQGSTNTLRSCGREVCGSRIGKDIDVKVLIPGTRKGKIVQIQGGKDCGQGHMQMRKKEFASWEIRSHGYGKISV